MGRSGRRTSVVALAATAMLTINVPSAAACSCVQGTLKKSVQGADAVYIARARLPDPAPGASFRISRVLKGPVRSNIRVGVTTGPGASCGTSVSGTDFVLPIRGGHPPHLSLCTGHLSGADAVAEARSIFGAGHAAPWRPDVIWAGQWLGIFALIIGVGVWLRLRRSRDVA